VVRRAFDDIIPAAPVLLAHAADAGVDLPAITAQLERDGVRAFRASYRELLDCIKTKLERTLDHSARLSQLG
jgi:hypothetical protein